MRAIFSAAALVCGSTIGYKYYTRLRPVTESEVIWAWLRSEMLREKSVLTDCYNQASEKRGNPVLINPNFDKLDESGRRKAIFLECRNMYLGPSEYVDSVSDLKDIYAIRAISERMNDVIFSWKDIENHVT